MIDREIAQMDTVKSKTRELDKYTGVYMLKPARKSYLAQMNPNHSGAVIFDEAKIYLGPEFDKTGLIKTGLTEQEARDLESDMGFAPNTLSPYNRAFWGEFKYYVQVPKDGYKLKLDNALDKLRYMYLRVHSKVSQSWEEALNNPLKEFVLVSTETEAKNETSKLQVKMEAMQTLAKMTINEQMEFLKVYDAGRYKVSVHSSPNFIFSTIGKIVDENPDAFLQTLANPDYKNMAFLQDAVQSGLVKKSGAKYFVVGGDILGQSFLDAVQNLGKPDFSELKVALKAKIDSTKDKKE